MSRFDIFTKGNPCTEPLGSSPNTKNTLKDSSFAAWHADARRSGKSSDYSVDRGTRQTFSKFSNRWAVRGNHSCSSTSRFQPFPSRNNEENEISISIHHSNDNINIQSGFLSYRGLVYNEAPKISVLFKPTTDDFRFRRLKYDEILNAHQGSL